jgi:hypothetical protein
VFLSEVLSGALDGTKEFAAELSAAQHEMESIDG